MFSAALKVKTWPLSNYNLATISRAIGTTMEHLPPANLRGEIVWKKLASASPCDPEIIASHQCAVTKKRYVLLCRSDNSFAVLENNQFLVFTCARNQLPANWKVPGNSIKPDYINRPDTP